MKKYISFALLLLSASLSAQTLKGVYTLSSVATGKNLDGNAENLYPFPPNGGDYQKWTIKQTGTTGTRKVYALSSVATGMRLECDGNRLYPRKPDDSRNQLWIIDPDNCVDCFTLTHLVTGKRLDGNAENLYPFDPNDGNYQKWRIVPVAPAPVTASNLSPAISQVSNTSTAVNPAQSTQKAVRFGDWQPWQPSRFGEFRWRWVANTAAADFPKFIEVEYEVKNTRKAKVNALASVMQCGAPDQGSKYYQKFTIEAGATQNVKAKVINCGTAEKPRVVKPYVMELIRID